MGSFSREAKIKCSGCEKNLLPERYSETAKKKYWDSLARNQRNSKVEIKNPKCTNCNAGNIHELTCIMCGTTKGLEDFAKVQRKKPDDAHCKDCQQEKVDREPNIQDEIEELKIEEEMRHSSFNTFSSHYSSTASVRRSQLGGGSTRYETDTNPGSDYIDGNDDVGIPPIIKSHASDTGSVIDSHRTDSSDWNDGVISSRTATGRGSGRQNSAGFARQGAVLPSRAEKAQAAMLRNNRIQEQQDDQAALVDSDSNDDDDDDDPY